MICTSCHGRKTVLSQYSKHRVKCYTCKGTGEVSNLYPENYRDSFESKEYERQRPLLTNPRDSSPFDKFFDNIK